jgi:hypothetical protein
MSEPLASGAEVHRIAGEPDDPTLVQWARFRDQFAQAMGDGFWTLEDLEQKIAAKRAFFFPGKNAAVVGEIQVYPGGERVMQFTWAVGDVDEIVAIEPGLVAISRMMGCTSVLIEGRMAWAKLMKPLGYEPWSVTLHKAI